MLRMHRRGRQFGPRAVSVAERGGLYTVSPPRSSDSIGTTLPTMIPSPCCGWTKWSIRFLAHDTKIVYICASNG